MKDPYKVLGIGPRASQREVKVAYLRLARTHHPDLDPGNTLSEDRFKDISAAYDLLSDPDKRKRFDAGEIGADGTTRTGAWRERANDAFRSTAARGGFDRFFRQRQEADNRAKRGAGKRASLRINGTNITYSITVDFLEAAKGLRRRVNMANGKDLNVTIAPGTEDGQTLRLKGQGTDGIGGGEPGDALIEVAVLPHPRFRRDGLNIHTDIPVTVPEAVLGTKIEAETIHGPLQVTVPEGSNTGTRLRLKGKGIGTGNKAGDHFITLSVMLPDKHDESLIKFVKKWVEKAPYQADRTKTNNRAKD